MTDDERGGGEEREEGEEEMHACMNEWSGTFSISLCRGKSVPGKGKKVLISLAFHWPGISGHKKKYSQLPPRHSASRPSCRLEAESEYAQSGQLVPWVPSWPLTPAGPPHPLAVLFPLHPPFSQFESLSGHSLPAKKHAQAFSQPLPLSVLLSPPRVALVANLVTTPWP